MTSYLDFEALADLAVARVRERYPESVWIGIGHLHQNIVLVGDETHTKLCSVELETGKIARFVLTDVSYCDLSLVHVRPRDPSDGYL